MPAMQARGTESGSPDLHTKSEVVAPACNPSAGEGLEGVALWVTGQLA